MIPRVLRDVSVTAVGGYVATAATMLRGFLLALVLSPLDIGTIAAISLVLAYSLYADLGVVQAVVRQIPLALGAGRNDEAGHLSLYGIAAPLLGGCVVSLGLLLFVLSKGAALHPDLRFGLSTACLVVILQAVAAAQQLLLRSRRRFRAAAFLSIAVSVSSLLAGLAGALLAGVRGVFLGQALASVLGVVVSFSLAGIPPLAIPSTKRWLRLIRAGFPLALLLFGAYGLVYIDQMMVLAYEGRRALGVYTIVMYVGTALFMIPSAVASAMGPRLLTRYGRHGTIDSIAELTWRPVAALSTVLPVVIMSMWILAPAAIVRFLPLYAESVAPLRIYLVGTFFLGVNAGVSDTLVALNKYRRNLPIVLGAVALNVALDVLLLGWMKLGLIGPALGSTITYFTYWLVCSGMVRRFFDKRLSSILRFNLGKGWPGFLIAAIAFGSWRNGTLGNSMVVDELPLLLLTVALMALRWRSLKLMAPEKPHPAITEVTAGGGAKEAGPGESSRR